MFVLIVLFIVTLAVGLILHKAQNDYDAYEYSFYAIVAGLIIVYAYDNIVRGVVGA